MFIRHAILETAELGELTLVAGDSALIGVYFQGHWHLPDPSEFGPRVELGTDLVLYDAAVELGQFLRGDRMTFALPTAMHGSEFEERVWSALRELPFGETTTYGDLAESLGDRNLARKVGQAVGRNPLSIVVGCHRVVGKGGELRGYAGGLDRKRFLLDLEAGRLRMSAAA
jgi:methylated-DNA-[protein]-cysteine S-methyltransferase